MQGRGNIACYCIGINIQSIALYIHSNRRDNRNVTVFEHYMENVRINDFTFSYPANIYFGLNTINDYLLCALFMTQDHSSVIPRKPNTFSPKQSDKGYNFGIDIPDEDHPGNFHSFVICNTEALEKFCLFAHKLHSVSYTHLRAHETG